MGKSLSEQIEALERRCSELESEYEYINKILYINFGEASKEFAFLKKSDVEEKSSKVLLRVVNRLKEKKK